MNASLWSSITITGNDCRNVWKAKSTRRASCVSDFSDVTNLITVPVFLTSQSGQIRLQPGRSMPRAACINHIWPVYRSTTIDLTGL